LYKYKNIFWNALKKQPPAAEQSGGEEIRLLLRQAEVIQLSGLPEQPGRINRVRQR
jgi:hypothetical protein